MCLVPGTVAAGDGREAAATGGGGGANGLALQMGQVRVCLRLTSGKREDGRRAVADEEEMEEESSCVVL